VSDAGVRRRGCHVRTLAQLGLDAALHRVLDDEDAVGALERPGQSGLVLHVRRDDLRPRRRERRRLGTVRLARDRLHAPAVREQMSCRRAAHATSRAQDGDRASDGSVHPTSWALRRQAWPC